MAFWLGQAELHLFPTWGAGAQATEPSSMLPSVLVGHWQEVEQLRETSTLSYGMWVSWEAA